MNIGRKDNCRAHLENPWELSGHNPQARGSITAEGMRSLPQGPVSIFVAGQAKAVAVSSAPGIVAAATRPNPDHTNLDPAGSQEFL